MIKAFDATKSDAKAVGIVDKALGTLGGLETWAAVKQVRWDTKVMFGEDLRSQYKHAWDRWNGRHRYENLDLASHKKALQYNDDKMRKWGVIFYDLFRGRGFATWGGKEVDSGTRAKMLEIAKKRFGEDTFMVYGIYKLKDPGVELKYDSETGESFGRCKPKCHRIKVTFDSRIGKDTYFFAINTETNMPEFIQKKIASGLLTYSFDKWVTVSGLKVATEFQNMGEKKEIVKVSNVKMGSPDDDLYVRRVR